MLNRYLGENNSVTKTKSLKSYIAYTCITAPKRINTDTTELGANIFSNDRLINTTPNMESKEEVKKIAAPKKSLIEIDQAKAKLVASEFNNFASSFVDMKNIDTSGISLGFIGSDTGNDEKPEKPTSKGSSGAKTIVAKQGSSKQAANAKDFFKGTVTADDDPVESVGDLLDKIL